MTCHVVCFTSTVHSNSIHPTNAPQCRRTTTTVSSISPQPTNNPQTNGASIVPSVFFSGPLGGGKFPPLNFKFPPQTVTKFVHFFGCFSHFLSPQKQFPPQNYVSRKNPDCTSCHSSSNCNHTVDHYSWSRHSCGSV